MKIGVNVEMMMIIVSVNLNHLKLKVDGK